MGLLCTSKNWGATTDDTGMSYRLKVPWEREARIPGTARRQVTLEQQALALLGKAPWAGNQRGREEGGYAGQKLPAEQQERVGA